MLNMFHIHFISLYILNDFLVHFGYPVKRDICSKGRKTGRQSDPTTYAVIIRRLVFITFLFENVGLYETCSDCNVGLVSFIYIMLATKERNVQRTKCPKNESSRVRIVLRTKHPRNETSKERIVHGTNRLENETSRERNVQRTNRPWYESS